MLRFLRNSLSSFLLIVLTAVFCFLSSAFFICQHTEFYKELVNSAIEQTRKPVKYDPAYVCIKYPLGDVPSNTGVCTDLVIRAYRKVGIDLQKEVHEHMLANFDKYPKLWKLKKTDSNIDHRRVPNLMTYFKFQNASIKISKNGNDYKPGDLVTWNLQNKNTMSGITHIGIVIDQKSEDGLRPLIAHNIGAGNVIEDMLFSCTIIGHYRFKFGAGD